MLPLLTLDFTAIVTGHGKTKAYLPLTPDFTAIVTGHGKTKAYLHRFYFMDNLTYTFKKAQKTVNHLIYEFPDIGQQRLKQINQIILNGDQWPDKSTTLLQALEKFLRIC